jgi:hypothetical protein
MQYKGGKCVSREVNAKDKCCKYIALNDYGGCSSAIDIKL